MLTNHIINQIENNDLLHNDQTLYVIGVCSNPARYHSRYRLARKWIEAMVKTKNVKLTVVEAAYGDRHHELERLSRHHGIEYLKLRTKSEIWIKENMINLGARHTLVKYPTAKYLAWIDMDVFFRDEDWALKTVQELQHFEVVQPWSDCLDLGPEGGVLSHHKSFGHQHQKRLRKAKRDSNGKPYYQFAHTGYAWACTRRFWEATSGLIDFPILGSGDHHMALGIIGEIEYSVNNLMHTSFFRKLHEWEARAMRVAKREVGYVMGAIEHMFHGPKKRRYYIERWKILVKHDFNPDVDLQYDSQGLLQLTGKPELEQDIHLYNLSRAEDSIDLE